METEEIISSANFKAHANNQLQWTLVAHTSSTKSLGNWCRNGPGAVGRLDQVKINKTWP